MPLMNAMGIVETEHSTIVGAPKMGQEKCEVITDHLSAVVNPKLLAENACSAGTCKIRLVVILFVRAFSSSHLVSYHRRCV